MHACVRQREIILWHVIGDVKFLFLHFGFKAVEQLNIKAKSYKDLLTDEPFTRQDIITLQVRLILKHGWVSAL